MIAYDNELPYKYKIPLSIYFRSDSRKTEEEISMNDYLGWIAEVLRDHEDYIAQIPEYIAQSDQINLQFNSSISAKVIKNKDNREDMQYRAQSMSKFSSKEYYYWEMLYFRPFKHK